MTRKSYLAEPHALCGTATVIEVIPGDRPVVRLDHTLFHAQGGGQKADRGRIGLAAVLHVAHSANDVDHIVDSAVDLAPGMSVTIEVDEAWRRLNAAYHTAGHLIACVVETLQPSLRAIAGHQWPGEGRVEFSGVVPANPLSVETINARLAESLAADLPVTIQGDPYANRSIRIGDYAPIPCGGTHISRLADLSVVRVLAVKTKNGLLRVSYEAHSNFGSGLFSQAHESHISLKGRANGSASR